jgi:hypothetical protein
MTKYWPFLLIWVFILACGSSKDNGGGRAPIPDFGRPEKPVEEKDTLTLKAETLMLTHITQVWKINSLLQDGGAENFLKLRKEFAFPIQFNGWVTLDRVEHNYSKCALEGGKEPRFMLVDDHNGAVLLQPGEKLPVSLEKLYIVRLEFANESICDFIDIQFGVLYGTND